MNQEVSRQRRRRDPEGTRTAILEAAQIILAQDGAEGLSVSGVAKLAGVNRGTAYQHFEFKEELIRATLDRVSTQLVEAVFPPGEFEQAGKSPLHIDGVIRQMAVFSFRLAEFAIENSDIARIWLYNTLARENPRDDIFYKRFEESVETLTASEAGEDDIDAEALSMLMLSGFFLWPVWVRARDKGKRARQQLARRFAGEVLRLNMHGVIKADSHALLESYLSDQSPGR